MNNATVTLPLDEFDYLRSQRDEYKTLKEELRRCLVMEGGSRYTYEQRNKKVIGVEMTDDLKRFIVNQFIENFAFTEELLGDY